MQKNFGTFLLNFLQCTSTDKNISNHAKTSVKSHVNFLVIFNNAFTPKLIYPLLTFLKPVYTLTPYYSLSFKQLFVLIDHFSLLDTFSNNVPILLMEN